MCPAVLLKAPWSNQATQLLGCPYAGSNSNKRKSPCSAHDLICSQEMDYHLDNCEYRNYQCPLSSSSSSSSSSESKCTWTGVKSDIETHLEMSHDRRFLIQKFGVCVTVLDGVDCHGDRTWLEFFQFCRKKYIMWMRKQSAKWFFNIQLIGSEFETIHLDCVISFVGGNGGESLSWGGMPRSIHRNVDPENLETTDICLQLDHREVGPFIGRDQLIVAVRIVDYCRQRRRRRGGEELDACAATITRSGRVVKPIKRLSEDHLRTPKRTQSRINK